MSHKPDKKPPISPKGTAAEAPRSAFDIQTIKRIFSYMGKYKAALFLVVLCILLSSIAGAVSGLFLQILIDDYITPLLAADPPVFTGLLHALLTLAVIYLIGVVASLLYNRIMNVGTVHPTTNFLYLYHCRRICLYALSELLPSSPYPEISAIPFPRFPISSTPS